jgi:tetratricopeptide (TPR) repeat protein
VAFSVSGAWVVAGLCALNLLIYSGVIAHPFIDLDDGAYIYLNPHVAAGLTWDSAVWAFRTGYQANWHPLTWLSHMLDVQLFGMNAGPHHAVNLLLHTLNTILLFGILARMTGALGRSAFAAALFAAHPLHVESVAWVAERKDVLSTFFWMLTVCAYIWYVRRPRPGRYALVAALFALGLMSKAMLVTLPFTLLLLDYWPLRRFGDGAGPKTKWPRLVSEKLPLFGLSIASSVVTFLVQRQGGAVSTLETLSPLERFSHAMISYVVYLAKAFWPADLAPFYPYSTPLWWTTIGSVAALIGITTLAIRTGRARPYIAVGWFWFMGTLVPVIGFVQVGQQAWADRYMYVPLIGLAIIASWGGYEMLGSRGKSVAASALAAAVILILSVAARLQAGYWQDSDSLWAHTVDVTANNAFAENRLGSALYLRGHFDDAIVHQTRALRIQPDFVDAHVDLALSLLRQGRASEAVAQDREAIGLNPTFALAHCNLGLALIRTGETDEAIRELNEALRLDPDNREARDGLLYLTNRRK